MSLWPIQDESTVTLMEAFYDRYLQRRDGLPAPEALRQAQLEALNANRDSYGEARPQQWGAFIVTATGS